MNGFKSSSYQLVPLKDLTVPKIDKRGPDGEGEFTYVDISSVDNKTKRIGDPKRLPAGEAPSRAKQRLQAGDVLVSMTRPNLNAVAIVPSELGDAIGSTGFHVLRAIEGVDPKWLYFGVQSHDFVSVMSGLVQGALYPAVRPKDINAFVLPVPPLEQQKRIVAEIEKQFSRLDEAVANLKRVKANLKRYKAAVLKAAVEGKLTEEWRAAQGRANVAGGQEPGATKSHPDVEPASKLLDRILAERRAKWEEAELAKMEAKGKAPKNAKWKAKYKEPVAPDNVDLPELPEGWAWASADQVCGSVRDGTHDTPAYVDAGVPLITSKNLTDDGIDFDRVKFISEEDHLEISRRSGVEPGDVLFAMIGTVGNPCEIKTDVQFSIKNVGLFKRNAEFLDSAYLCNWLASPQFDRWLGPRLKGTTQKFAPLGLLRAIPIPLMSVDEQQRITMEVERRLSLIREAVSQVDANERRSVRLRQSILAAALSGSLSSEYLSLPKLAVS